MIPLYDSLRTSLDKAYQALLTLLIYSDKDMQKSYFYNKKDHIYYMFQSKLICICKNIHIPYIISYKWSLNKK